MERKSQDQHQEKEQLRSSANDLESSESISAPLFNPTVGTSKIQMQVEEGEEELQTKMQPFQLSAEDEEDKEVQMKPFQLSPEKENKELQMKADQTTSKNEKTEYSSKTNLPKSVQAKMESSFNSDFSGVAIHKDSTKAQNLGAQAFAQGNEVHFAKGKYDPNSQSGQELIGHELTHVVQQRQGRVQTTSQRKGANVNDSSSLEQEADQMGRKAANHQVNITRGFEGTNARIERPITQLKTAPIQMHPGGHAEEETEQGHDHEDEIDSGEHTDQNSETENQEASVMDLIELAIFNLQSTWGPRSLVPPIFSNQRGYGGFEATYNRPAKSLNVTVRGKTQFINGLSDSGRTITSSQEDLDQLANILNIINDPTLNGNVVGAYTWDDTSKEAAKEQFRLRLGEAIGIWENTGMQFYVNKPGWDEITANLSVNLEVDEEGTLGDTASRTSQGQHQQIQIYKTPDPSQLSSVRAAVNAAISKYESDNQMSIGRVSGYDVRAYVDGDTDSSGYADDNAHNGSMTLSSNDLANSQSNEDYSMMSNRVFFDHDSAVLSQDSIDDIKWFIGRFKGSGDSNFTNNGITLTGHTSSSGSAEYNSGLAERRVAAVKTVLQGEGISNLTERLSESSKGETDNNANPDGNEAYYRAVDIKIGSGERQNTVAHEFGHVFGLADEYEEGGRSAGDNSGHDRLSKRMGTGAAPVENNDGIISMGNEVRAQHYSVFVWALRELTGKEWRVRDQS